MRTVAQSRILPSMLAASSATSAEAFLATSNSPWIARVRLR